MKNIMLINCVIILISVINISTSSAYEMKCIGALIHNDNIEDLRDSKTELSYMFPCLDSRVNPQQVMCLQINENKFDQRTIHVYRIKDLRKGCLVEIQPQAIFPIRKKSFGPFGFDNTVIPYSFQNGLYFLVKYENSKWCIHQMDKKKSSPIYCGKDFPWFFQKMDNNHLAYSIGKKIYLSNKIIYKGNYHIVSFDLPDKHHNVICYYNDRHNPNIELRMNNQSFVFDSQMSEFNPKLSTQKDYFAYMLNRQDNPEIWDIIIRKTHSPDKIAKIITDVKIYDIEMIAFFYHDSFQWLENRLYFMKNDPKLSIFEFNPKTAKISEIKFSGNSFQNTVTVHNKFKKSEKKEDKKSISLIIDIVAMNWFQVAKNKQGQLMFIIDCLITASCPSNPGTKVPSKLVQRILLFQ